LQEYYKVIAGLDDQLKCGNSQLTLRNLVLWIAEPMKRLKWIYSIIYVHNEKKESSILHTLDSFSKYGDAQTAKSVNGMLIKSAQPTLEMILTYECLESFHFFTVESIGGFSMES
jgi:hypothetical protein